MKNYRAFSLFELLVGIGIVGLLMGLLLPVVQLAPESMRRVTCGKTLKQIGLPLQIHGQSKRRILEWTGGHLDYESVHGPKKSYDLLSTLYADGSYTYPPRAVLLNRIHTQRAVSQLVVWAVERFDGGRCFVFTGGQFFAHWRTDVFRYLIANAVLWAANAADDREPQSGTDGAQRRTATPGAVAPESSVPFHRHLLTAHCYKCHAAPAAEGGVRLDDLAAEITTVEMAERWQKVLNVLNSGEMPPEDEPRPDAATKTEFLADLSLALATARKTIGDQGRIASLRRLNRREYQNTLRDLLGIDIAVTDLPDDKGTGSFDTAGSALFMSSDQFEQYLTIGRRAAHAAIDQWQQSLAPASAPKVQRTEAEVAYRETNMWLLRDVYLEGYKTAMSLKAEGKEYLAFAVQQYEHRAAYLGQALALPLAGKGAYLTAFLPLYTHTQVIAIPKSMPPGAYKLRLRIGATAGSPEKRRFLEMGQSPGDRNDSFSNFVRTGLFQITASAADPQLLDIPVTVTRAGERNWLFREKRHSTVDDWVPYFVARDRNGIGPDPSLWIDWVEWEGPVPQPDVSAQLQSTFGGLAEDSAVRGILQRFATKALRGGVPSPEVIDQLVAMYDARRRQGDSFADALVEPMAVILASPGFLYLTDPTAAGTGTDVPIDRQLTDRELAARLSYFLWSGPPDDLLLAAVTAGSLRTAAGLAAQVDRMIANPRSLALARDFTHQWLSMDRLDFFQFEPWIHADFDDPTRDAAKNEVYRTVHMLLQDDLDARNLLKTDFVVINGLLATYYGLADLSDPAGPKPIVGDEFRKVLLPAGHPRGGLLGMAAILGMGSNGLQSSPVERGAWVLRKLLNDPPPPAPPNVPQLSRLQGQEISTRERLNMHQEEAQCAQCHRRIDPIGFGLENFDAAGRWRSEEHLYKEDWLAKGTARGKTVSKRFPIDPAGAFHDGPAFKDFFELRDLIAARGDDFLQGLIENLYAYALGRPVSFADADTIDGLVAQAKANGGGLASIIQSIVATPEFRTK